MLHVVEALSGGIGRHLVDIIRNVPQATHEVALPRGRHGWVEGERPAQRMQQAGARLHYVDMSRSPVHPINAVAIRRVGGLIADLRPQVVHGHSSIGGAVARLAARPNKAARVYTPHALHPSWLALRVERRLGRRTDRLVAVSESEGRSILRSRVIAPDRLTVIANAIDLQAPAPEGLDLRAIIGVEAGIPLIGAVGRLVAQKSPDLFAIAAAEIAGRSPEPHFVLIGSGPLESRVRGLAREHGIESRFHIVPWLEDASAALPQLDVLVSASRYEGGPYVPLEGMCAGVPLVLTDVTGNVDVVEDGVSGLVVPSQDPKAMAAAIRRLLDDTELSHRLVAAARVRLAERFDVRVMGRRTSELYAELAR